jgi:hypothetical protein
VAKRVDGTDLFKLWVVTAVVIGGSIYVNGTGSATCAVPGPGVTSCFITALAYALQPYLAIGALVLVVLSLACTILYRFRR